MILGLLMAVVFTVSLSETVKMADGFSVSGERLTFDIGVGETQMQEWMIKNRSNSTITVEIYTTNPGSELITFEKFHILEPGDRVTPEIFVIVPKDHPDNIEYHIDLYGLVRGELPEGATGIVVNNQARTFIDIKIGDNPIYTAPLVPKKSEVPTAQPKPTPKPIIEKPIVEVIEETLEEKLKRIQEANEKTKAPETSPIDSPVVEKTETPTSEYEPEPIIKSEPIVKSSTTIEPIKECNFIDVILSWFGFSKC